MELQLHDSDEDLYEEWFQASYPPPREQQSNHSHASQWSRSCSMHFPKHHPDGSHPIPGLIPTKKITDQRNYNLSNLICSPPCHSHRSATGNLACCGVASPRRPTLYLRSEDDISNRPSPASARLLLYNSSTTP
ncbi:Hypothetical predicted protein [Xyrichtys novacula]|uniref:Uncharacterized protein n=1 Tax=Xyrichtys novacula TaxID=13765 RepID=A0AAV1FYH9_XYRNO|nr:Hypothetical predicted protein [Xyrichtys novacula]